MRRGEKAIFDAMCAWWGGMACGVLDVWEMEDVGYRPNGLPAACRAPEGPHPGRAASTALCRCALGVADLVTRCRRTR